MKIICLYYKDPWDGAELMGLYSTYEKAEEAKMNFITKWPYAYRISNDYWSIDEEIVDKELN